MSTINDRIGSQNVIRVLSNASAPPSRLANLGDVDATRETETGIISITLSAANTVSLKPGRYVYDVQIITSGGLKYKAIEGNALVRSGVTR